MNYRIKRFSQNKTFSNKVILPGNKRPCDPLPQKFTDDPKYKHITNRIVEVDTTPTFDRKFNRASSFNKEVIKRLRKSIKNGHIYDNGSPGEETHYKASESKPGKYHRLTKDINKQDRLEYLVYPPTVLINPGTGEKFLSTRVVLRDCELHRNDFKQTNWSEKESD